MAPPIEIRHASAIDADLISRLGRETFSDTFSRDNTPEDMAIYVAQAFSPEIQAAELADVKSCTLIAEADGTPVGYARLVEGAPSVTIAAVKPIEIVRLYARSAWIGHGVGAQLMRACLDTARSLGRDAIWLGVWERNRRAIAFYEKWGFRQIGSHPFHVGHDLQTDWLMLRTLS